MIVELAQVVVIFLIVQSWKDAAASQLWQILEEKKQTKSTLREGFMCNKVFFYITGNDLVHAVVT